MPNNEQRPIHSPQVLAGMLEASNDALLAYVLRNATVELNHDSILAFIQRQRELCQDLKRAQLLDQLNLSLELMTKSPERLRKEQNGE